VRGEASLFTAIATFGTWDTSAMTSESVEPSLAKLSSALLGYLRRSLDRDGAYHQPLRPLVGGFVTDVYSFELDSAPDGWQGPLVLRIYPADVDALGIRRECCAQAVVSAQGAPAPRVLAWEDTAGSLGRPFMIMELLPGRPQISIEFPRILIEVPRLRTLPRRHAAAMALVHALDATGLLRAFEAAGIDRRRAGPEHWLDAAETTIARWEFDALRPGLEWLRSRRPAEPQRYAICHGDLFGANILETDGRVTGLLDWNQVTVADPAFDVGGQVAAYEMSAVPGPRVVQAVATAFGRWLASGFRRAYGRYRAIAEERVTYYAVMRAFTEMTFKLGLQAEIRATGVLRRMPTWRPDQCARYIRRRTGLAIDTDACGRS
jgi:aminoglycoside phosphotransferase (APT) family kinase protein